MGKVIAGTTIAIVMLSSAVAQAGPAACLAGLRNGCACSVALPSPGPVGHLSEIVGNVLLATDVGYSPIRAATDVRLNDQISVGKGGRVLLNVAGQCELRLVGPKKVVVRSEGACACASFVTSPATSTDLAGSVANAMAQAGSSDGAADATNGGAADGAANATGGGAVSGSSIGSGVNTVLLAGAGVVAAGVAAAVVTQSRAPASP